MFSPDTDLTPFYEDLELFWKMLILQKGIKDDFKYLVVKSSFHGKRITRVLFFQIRFRNWIHLAIF